MSSHTNLPRGLSGNTNFIGFTAHHLSKSVLASNQLSEADASCAVDAAGHGGLDERSELLVLDSTLVFHETTFIVAID